MKNKINEELVLLIRSMSPAEKRGFSLYSAKYRAKERGEKNYLELYRRMAQLGEGEAIPRVQEDTADYLIGLLTESLLFQRRSSAETEMRAQLAAATLLHRRGLEKRAARIFEKLYISGLESCAYEFGLDLLQTQIQLFSSIDLLDELRELMVRRNALLDRLIKHRRYDDIMLDLFRTLSENNTGKIKNIIRSPLLRRTSNDLRTEVQRLHLLAHAHLCIGETTKGGKYHLQLKKIFEDHPAYLRVRVHLYLVIVLNTGIMAYQSENTERLLESIESLETLPQRIPGFITGIDRDRITRYVLDMRLRYALLNNEAETGLKLLPGIRNCLRQDKKTEPYRVNYLRYNTALCLFRRQRFREALGWLQPVIDDRRKGYYNQKTYGLAYLLRIACHLQLQHEETAEPLIRSFRRNRFFEPLRKNEQFRRLLSGMPGNLQSKDWLL
ncbi:MAG: hypothetical protein FD123_3237 [Bacteroidetes bacterium]|nr:MAG: hypothetical protein FD123_3237 [Bacteroidota bacterium]